MFFIYTFSYFSWLVFWPFWSFNRPSKLAPCLKGRHLVSNLHQAWFQRPTNVAAGIPVSCYACGLNSSRKSMVDDGCICCICLQFQWAKAAAICSLSIAYNGWHSSWHGITFLPQHGDWTKSHNFPIKLIKRFGMNIGTSASCIPLPPSWLKACSSSFKAHRMALWFYGILIQEFINPSYNIHHI